MGRRPRIDRTPEKKWQIVQEGMKSGNVSETCRRHGIAPNLYYRWRDEAEQGAKAALGGRSAAAAEPEKDHRHPAAGTSAGAEVAGNRNPKKRRRGVSCGEVHSQARELVSQGYISHASSEHAAHKPVEFVLPEEATGQPGRPHR